MPMFINKKLMSSYFNDKLKLHTDEKNAFVFVSHK